MPYSDKTARFAQEDLTSAISGGVQSARRLLTKTSVSCLQSLQAA
jgi:hypothetical protein